MGLIYSVVLCIKTALCCVVFINPVLQSPTEISEKILAGDEVIQVNGQIVVSSNSPVLMITVLIVICWVVNIKTSVSKEIRQGSNERG